MLDNLWHDSDFSKDVDASIDVSSLDSSTADIPLVWEAHGGYDHPQPGTRLIQYGQGWMPDKSINLGVIYNNYLVNGQPIKIDEQVQRWLRKSGVTKVIVGHQPNGDAPLVIRSECEDGRNVYVRCLLLEY